MDMEELTKSQVVLLTLLVSFFTSMATGVVTVSLMTKSPSSSVTETVNRIITNTIEKTLPSSQTAATVVTQQKTVVVNQSDALAAAIQKATPSLVRLYSHNSDTPTFWGLGVVLTSGGIIVSDSAALGDAAEATVHTANGTSVRVFVTSRDKTNGLAFLQVATSTDIKTLVTAAPPANALSSTPALGASVFALAGKSTTRVGSGIITSITPATAGTSQTFETSISNDTSLFGSPLYDINGNLVGISTGVSREGSASDFISSLAINASLSNALKQIASTGQ